MVARLVVDVDCDAAEGRDFGGEAGEGVVVLGFVGVGVGHFGGCLWGKERCSAIEAEVVVVMRAQMVS